jgi:hypothetical protein
MVWLMRNVLSRPLPVPASAAADVLADFADPAKSVWPSRSWPRLHLDPVLAPGSAGRHGPIRYTVEEYLPGRHIRFRFDPSCGAVGTHELRVEPAGPDSCVLIHDIRARTRGRMLVLWPLAIRWLHEALVADLLDNAERRLTGGLAGPQTHWSPWVRLVRRLG